MNGTKIGNGLAYEAQATGNHDVYGLKANAQSKRNGRGRTVQKRWTTKTESSFGTNKNVEESPRQASSFRVHWTQSHGSLDPLSRDRPRTPHAPLDPVDRSFFISMLESV